MILYGMRLLFFWLFLEINYQTLFQFFGGNNASGFKFSDIACFDIQLTGEHFMHKLLCFACKNSILYFCLVVIYLVRIFSWEKLCDRYIGGRDLLQSNLENRLRINVSSASNCCFTKKKTLIKMCPLRNKTKSIFLKGF